MTQETITSSSNLKIKQIKKLRQAHNRKKADLIIVEGQKEISRAVSVGLEIKELFYCPEIARVRINFDELKSQAVVEVSEPVFNKITYREHPDGYLALARPKYLGLEKITLSPIPLLIILESIEKPGNLGAILRSADAAQADAVIVCDPRTDIYNPNVIRASLGAVFTQQTAVCSTAEAISWFRKNKIKSFAAVAQNSQPYFKADYRQASAIIIGTEHAGLSVAWIKAADEKIHIPMPGQADSLNASVSAAIILFEALRQRSS